MAVVMFGGMCRYDDASGLQWKNVRFVEDGSSFEITFDKRKNAQFRQGNKVLVSANPSATVCPVRLLRELYALTGGSEDLFVFRGFNGRLVAKRSRSTAPGAAKITYDQYFRYLGQWFSGVMGISLAAFRKKFATQSGRSGGASAAVNAGVADELIGQHGDWKTKASQRRYMKSDSARLLSVSRAAMGSTKTPAPDVRIEDESAGVPPEMAEVDLPPEVIGVPPGAFVWS
jgi:integrase